MYVLRVYVYMCSLENTYKGLKLTNHIESFLSILGLENTYKGLKLA